jgi:ribosome-binding protein aMBF1 (putative translation factor)
MAIRAKKTSKEVIMDFIESFCRTGNFGDYVASSNERIGVVDISEAFGKAVKLRRVECDLSQEALAEKADFARSFVSAVELGNKSASVNSVWRLSQALGCKPSELWSTAERLMQTQTRRKSG